MSFTFRRRVKVLPGIYFNLSRRGVSTTIGPRGANISIGKRGVYLNTGIQGTGLSNRQKLFGGSTTNPNISVDLDTTPLPQADELRKNFRETSKPNCKYSIIDKRNSHNNNS